MERVIRLPVVAGTVLVLWLISSTLYNIFFHPLRKYPGPALAKITGWYEFFNVKDGYHHLWLYQMHQEYGSVVRVAPNRLSYNTVEAVRGIYGDRKGYIKKAGFTEAIALLKGDARNLQTINDRHAYAIRRRLISHAFSEEALHSSEAYILNCIQNWFDIIRSKANDDKSWTSDIDMTLWASLLTQDILGELCFGESFGACNQGSSDIDSFIMDGAAQAHKLAWMPLIDGVYKVIGMIADYGFKHQWEAMKPQTNYDHRIDSMIQRRLKAEGASRKDFFYYIAQAKDVETGQMISKEEVNVEAGVLFGAGADTSATCIAACLFYLTKHPNVLAKVASEVRDTFSNVDDIILSPKLRSLAYLRACIDETLRLSPPVPGPLLREVCGNGIVINGKVLPTGTQLSVPSYAIHHHKSYFPDPFAFSPERWLADSKDAHKEAFIPFSFGQRSCVGRSLAYLDMTLALARLLFSFDIRLSPGSDTDDEKLIESKRPLIKPDHQVEFAIKDWFITEKKGPLVQFRVRNPN